MSLTLQHWIIWTHVHYGWKASNHNLRRRVTRWFIALPSAKVEGTLTYNGQTHHVHGEGYHDHNRGTVSFNQILDRWFWTTGHFGNYTLDAGLQVTTSYYNHQQLPAFYLARGNQVLINEMNHFTVHGSGNLTTPGGHDYPKTMNFHWQNGTDTVKNSIRMNDRTQE